MPPRAVLFDFNGTLSDDEPIMCEILSRVPTELAHLNRRLGSTIQFINVAINPARPCEVMGGTQDNATWSMGCSRNDWPQIMYGDGGNAVYDATNPTWRANTFTSGAGDSNFRNGDPERWVIATAPLINSGEGPAFYWPQIGDPNPAPGTHPIYEGGKHVWRSWAFGGGHPGNVPQDSAPDIAFYEANCQEFVVPAATSACGDYRPLGGPMCVGAAQCVNALGDLTAPRTGLRATAAAARARGSPGTVPTTPPCGPRPPRAGSSSPTMRT
jgi:hypothetical protein